MEENIIDKEGKGGEPDITGDFVYTYSFEFEPALLRHTAFRIEF